MQCERIPNGLLGVLRPHPFERRWQRHILNVWGPQHRYIVREKRLLRGARHRRARRRGRHCGLFVAPSSDFLWQRASTIRSQCATNGTDGLPLDHLASVVEADSSSPSVTPHTVWLVHGGRHCGLLFLIPSPAVVRFCALKVLLRGQHDVPALHAAPRLRRWIGCAACSGSGVACRHGSREANELEA